MTKIKPGHPYVTLLVPYAPPPFRTEWHPTDATGIYSTLNRGAFSDVAAAITWGRDHLGGTPYTLRWEFPVKLDRVPHDEGALLPSNCPVCSASCYDYLVAGLKDSYISACEEHKYSVALDALEEQDE